MTFFIRSTYSSVRVHFALRRRLVQRVKFLTLLVLTIGLAIALGAMPTPQTAQGAAPAMSPGCAYLNGIGHLNMMAGGSSFGTALWDGETIIIQASPYPGSVATSIRLCLGSTNCAGGAPVVASAPIPGGFAYTVQGTLDPITIDWQTDIDNATWDITCHPRGCDALIAMTPDAVVGRITKETPLYFAPGQMIEPAVTLSAGKTAWVLGKNADGAYYQIVWACDKLWVPANAIGPNTGDPVWQGAPLPTGVVQ